MTWNHILLFGIQVAEDGCCHVNYNEYLYLQKVHSDKAGLGHFCDYFSVRISDYELRLNDRLDIPHARTDMGLNRCDVIGARLWNKHLELANKYLFKKSFRKQISKVLIENYR